MNYDLILEHLGEKGPWQLLHLSLLWLPAIGGGMFVLQTSFTAYEPGEFRCVIPYCDGPSASYGDYDVNYVLPKTEDDDDESKLVPDYCKYYPIVRWNISYEPGDKCSYEFFSNTSSLDCTKGNFIYPLYPEYEDIFEFSSNIVTDFDLVCDDHYKVALVGSIYMVGLLVSSFVTGTLADKIGRKLTLMMAILIGVTGSMCGAFCDSYAGYCVTRFLTAFGAMGMFLLPFNLSVELVGNEWKTFIGNLIQTPFAIGEAIVSAVAIGFRDWKDFTLVTSAPLYLMLGLYFILPESPRWLIATKRYKQAKKVIEQAAKMNKKTIPEELLQIPDETQAEEDNKSSAGLVEKKEPLGFKALFATRAMTKNTIIMWINWIIVTLGYYGISMSMGDISEDLFVGLILVSLIEIPSYIFCIFTMDHIGRKPIFVYALFVTGVFCIGSGFMDEGTARTTLALIGKFGASASFSIVYLFTAELYPTEIRSTATGLCSMFARIGGIMAPQIAYSLPDKTFDAFPMLFMGTCALVGGVLAIFLPETLGSDLVETLDDVDQLGKDAKPFFAWWTTKQLKEHMKRQHEMKAAKAVKEQHN